MQLICSQDVLPEPGLCSLQVFNKALFSARCREISHPPPLLSPQNAPHIALGPHLRPPFLGVPSALCQTPGECSGGQGGGAACGSEPCSPHTFSVCPHGCCASFPLLLQPQEQIPWLLFPALWHREGFWRAQECSGVLFAVGSWLWGRGSAERSNPSVSLPQVTASSSQRRLRCSHGSRRCYGNKTWPGERERGWG